MLCAYMEEMMPTTFALCSEAGVRSPLYQINKHMLYDDCVGVLVLLPRNGTIYRHYRLGVTSTIIL